VPRYLSMDMVRARTSGHHSCDSLRYITVWSGILVLKDDFDLF